MKLIKLSDEHYIVVDESEIKENDWCLINNKYIHQNIENDEDYLKNHCRKITHSTKTRLIDEEKGYTSMQGVINLPLSEVEEAINGYSVEKIINKVVNDYYDNSDNQQYCDYQTYGKSFTDGFKAHQELVKDKLFTIEDVRKAIEMAREKDRIVLHQSDYSEYLYNKNEIIQSLSPKTEWDITIDEQGKITLL